MTRMIVGFDPSKAQTAIAELSTGVGPGVQWRVLNLDQNPNGVEPVRAAPGSGEDQHGVAANLFQRLTGWLGKANQQTQRQERKPVSTTTHPSQQAHDSGATEGSGLELSEEELAYLRRAPARAATVILVTAPGSQDANLRMWMVRHGGFNLAHTQVGTDQA